MEQIGKCPHGHGRMWDPAGKPTDPAKPFCVICHHTQGEPCNGHCDYNGKLQMGLDDLVDDKKEEHENEEVNSVADDLGIEDKEQLESFNETLVHLRRIILIHDSKLEELEQVQSDIDELRKEIEDINTKIEIIAEKIKDDD